MSLIIPANSAAASGGYAVDNSCRFNSASNDHLNRTQTAGNRRKFTFSTWVKRCNPATRMSLFLANRSGSNYDQLYLNECGYLEADFYHSGTQIFRYKTNALYRDTSAWYHMILAVDTEHDTASSRVRIYVNGLEVTSFSTETNPSENVDTHVNENSIVAYIGSDYNSNEPDYYLAETVMLDGTQATPTDFGEFDEDSGIWKPIDVSGLTFGTNGFYLDFEASGNLGNDANGGTDLTESGLAATDQSTDTCTNNFATMNPLDNFYAGGTFAEGNLQVVTRDTGYSYNTSTFGVATGKWYWEVKWSAQNTGSTNQVLIGIAKRTVPSTTTWLGSQLYTYGYQGSDGHVKNNNGNATGSSATTYSVGDIISVALDLDNNKIHFAKNGTYTNSSDPAGNSGGVTITAPDSTSGDSGFYFPAFGDGNNNLVETGQFNFGSPPYSESGGETDGNGYGNFAHEPPSGYYALNTKNLAEYG